MEKQLSTSGSSSASSPVLLERSLFHGTPDEATVRCICHQNFDPRMHGRHGTVYGKGAYFCSMAQYSHKFTQPVKRSGRRFVFYARVLVGQSVVGTSAYQRPPPLDPKRPYGTLYDTCVDNIANPRIIVVFDNVQCYPEFLIEYEVDAVFDAAMPRRPPQPQNLQVPHSLSNVPGTVPGASFFTPPLTSSASTPVAAPNVQFIASATGLIIINRPSTTFEYPSRLPSVPLSSQLNSACVSQAAQSAAFVSQPGPGLVSSQPGPFTATPVSLAAAAGATSSIVPKSKNEPCLIM
jgi:hypothetical protein